MSIKNKYYEKEVTRIIKGNQRGLNRGCIVYTRGKNTAEVDQGSVELGGVGTRVRTSPDYENAPAH
jgi:hypothetical protein